MKNRKQIAEARNRITAEVVGWFQIAKIASCATINLYYSPNQKVFEEITSKVIYKGKDLSKLCGLYEYEGELYQLKAGQGDCEEFKGGKMNYALTKSGKPNKGKYYWTYRRIENPAYPMCDYIPLTFFEAEKLYGTNLLQRLDWSQR